MGDSENPRFGRDGPVLSDLAADVVRQPFSNTTRGLLVEALVARLVGGELCDPWSWADVKLEHWTLEVKSTANVQAWLAEPAQERRLQWSVGASRPWNPDTGQMAVQASRWADLYVLARLQAKATDLAEFMNPSNWTFYLVATDWLDAHHPSAKSVSLKMLKRELKGAAPRDVCKTEPKDLCDAVHRCLSDRVHRPDPAWEPLKSAKRVMAVAENLDVDPATAQKIIDVTLPELW